MATVAAGQDTRGVTANATADGLQLGMGSIPNGTPTWDVDDLYVLDGTASTPANNDFLGDVRVEGLDPNAAGSNAAWTPSAGANYACVNETPPTDDTSYVVVHRGTA